MDDKPKPVIHGDYNLENSTFTKQTSIDENVKKTLKSKQHSNLPSKPNKRFEIRPTDISDA